MSPPCWNSAGRWARGAADRQGAGVPSPEPPIASTPPTSLRRAISGESGHDVDAHRQLAEALEAGQPWREVAAILDGGHRRG